MNLIMTRKPSILDGNLKLSVQFNEISFLLFLNGKVQFPYALESRKLNRLTSISL